MSVNTCVAIFVLYLVGRKRCTYVVKCFNRYDYTF